MATGTTSKSRCLVCSKEKARSKCSGCLQDFCFNHLAEHRQELAKQLDDLENERNAFRQNLSEHTANIQTHLFIEQIGQWGQKSIEKIEQAVEEAKLTKLTEELKRTRQEEDFNEIDLNGLREKLTELGQKLTQSASISIDQDLSSFINEISVLNFLNK